MSSISPEKSLTDSSLTDSGDGDRLDTEPRGLTPRYRIRRRLGSGCAGSVFLAFDETRDCDVALKIVHRPRGAQDAQAQFKREFQSIAALRHSHIARAFDFGYTQEGRPFYTREYVRGLPLVGGLPHSCDPRRQLRSIVDVLQALCYLHDNEILHLDLHPGNVIVAEDEERGTVLIDFGFVSYASLRSVAASASGSAAVPPELLAGRRPTPQSDIYLAGALLLFALTGRRSGPARLPRELSDWGPRLTLDLERIIDKALERDPRNRFDSAREFLEVFTQSLGNRSASYSTATPPDVLVGRKRELSALDAALDEATRGNRARIVFVGTAGIGKTRILEEARMRAQVRGLNTVVVDGVERGRRGPQLIAAIRAARTDTTNGATFSVDWLRPLDVARGGAPAERAQRAAEAFFFEGDQPVVFIVDDFERLDAESRQLLDALLGEAGCSHVDDRPKRGLALLVASRFQGDDSRRDTTLISPLSVTAATELVRKRCATLPVSTRLLGEVLRRGEGSPRSLLRLIAALRREHTRVGALPDRLDFVEDAPPLDAAAREFDGLLSAESCRVVDVLQAVGWPLNTGELAAALEMSRASVRRALAALRRDEMVRAVGRASETHYELCVARVVAAEVSNVPTKRTVHQKIATWLRSKKRRSPRDREYTVRHLLCCGDVEAAVAEVEDALRALRFEGSFGRALELLRDVLQQDLADSTRCDLTESISEIADETGDHAAGIDALAPLWADVRQRGLQTRRAVRILRRLGVHYHRDGQAELALSTFAEAQRAATGESCREDSSPLPVDSDHSVPVKPGTEALETGDLILIDSELAELFTFRGDYEAAEAACLRGLERLRSTSESVLLRRRMEMTLRASLGHLQMRRFRLTDARAELETSLALARRVDDVANRSAILNNLAITTNQQSDFQAALESFSEAKEVLEEAGEKRGVIKVAANLAIILAKLGRREESDAELRAAQQLLPYYPGKRLEFFVEYSRGTAAHFTGEVDRTIDSFERSLPLGVELGDEHMVRYGRIYLAEAHMVRGDYRRALTILNDLERSSESVASGDRLLVRMVAVRVFCVESLLGRPRKAAAAAARYAATERTSIDQLEAWNDLYCAVARAASGEDSDPELTRSITEFDRLGIPAGVRLGKLLRLAVAIATEDRTALRRLIADLRCVTRPDHRFVAVAEPLLLAEADLLTGRRNNAESLCREASTAMVGASFAELDWRVEFVKTRLVMSAGDTDAARLHLQRSAHAKDLLVQGVSTRFRRGLQSHPRFARLDDWLRRLDRSPRIHHSTARLREGTSFLGMVGRSPAIRAVFRQVENVVHRDLPVLLTGLTGTGKDLLAKGIHDASTRSDSPFLAIPCASLPVEIFEVELFGAKAGAYTGADEDRPGLLETARGGTIYFDEIVELSMVAQASLLRVLDEGSYRPVGGVDRVVCDVRVLASTSEDLDAAIAAGRFRRDLFYRLATIHIELPPLKNRDGDPALVARHLLNRHAQTFGVAAPTLSRETEEALNAYSWPGNVRELDAIVMRSLLADTDADAAIKNRVRELIVSRREESGGARIMLDHRAVAECGLADLKRELERQYLTGVYIACAGDAQQMMDKLGVKRTRLYTWFRSLGLDVRELRRRLDGKS